MPRAVKKEKLEEIESKIDEILVIKPKITRKPKPEPVIATPEPIIVPELVKNTEPINIIKPKKKVIFC